MLIIAFESNHACIAFGSKIFAKQKYLRIANEREITLTPNLSFLEGHQTTNLKLNYLDLHIGQGSS